MSGFIVLRHWFTQDKVLLGLFVTLFLTFGILMIAFTSPFNGPDEIGHYRYAEFVFQRKTLPVLWVTWEAHQPPLYYYVLQPLFPLTSGLLLVDRLYVLRFVSLFLSAGTLLFTYATIRRLFPSEKALHWFAALLVALNPQFIFMSGMVNSDALAYLFGSAVLYFLVLFMKPGTVRWSLYVIFGLVTLGAFLTKMALWPMLVIAWGIVGIWRYKNALLTVGSLVPVAVAAKWWIGRNLHLYGTVTPFAELKNIWHDQYRFFLNYEGLREWFTTLYESYWARFGHFDIVASPVFYLGIKIIGIAALIGLCIFLVKRWRTLDRWIKWFLGILTLAAITIFAGVLYYNLSFYQPQGRYLFPAISAFSILMSIGLHQLVPRTLKKALLAVITVFLLTFTIHSLVIVSRFG